MVCGHGKFSLSEQIWMQISFHGVWILGTIAIWQENPVIAIAYVLFVIWGILWFIMHLVICPRCPHIKEHGACIQLPPFLTKRMIKKNVTGSLKAYEKIGFFVILYGVLTIPVYWIIDYLLLLIPFAVFGIMHYAAYFVVFCKKCLNANCPQNLNNELALF